MQRRHHPRTHRRPHRHITICAIPNDIGQRIAIVVDMIDKEAEADAQGLGPLNLRRRDQRIMLQPMGQTGVGRCRLKSVQNLINGALPLGMYRDLVPLRLQVCYGGAEIAGFIVHRPQVTMGNMHPL